MPIRARWGSARVRPRKRAAPRAGFLSPLVWHVPCSTRSQHRQGGSNDERTGHDDTVDDDEAGGAQVGIADAEPVCECLHGDLALQALRIASRPGGSSGEGAVRGPAAAPVSPSRKALSGPAALPNGLSGRWVGRKRGGAQGVPTVSSFRRVSRTPYHSETGRPELRSGPPVLAERPVRPSAIPRPEHVPPCSGHFSACFTRRFA